MKDTYTIYDAYSGDDVFTGTLEQCEEWTKKIVSLYGEKRLHRYSEPVRNSIQ